MARKKSKSCTYRIKVLKNYREKSKEDLLDELVDSKVEIKELKKKLRRYENPHTPPSKQKKKHKNSTKTKSKTSLGVGKKTGYKGATRKSKQPTKFINSFDEVCSQCGKHTTPLKIKSKIYEEIPDPQPVKIIKVEWGSYKCSCGHCWESKPKKVPLKGRFGKNFQTQVTLLRFDDRLPLRKTVAAIKRQFKTTISSKTTFNITQRVANKITPEYENMKKTIKQAKQLHIDETKIKIQGKTHWLWIFRTGKTVFFIIRKSRGKKVLKEILGKNYQGYIICDGWHAYKSYTKYLQRCWAHILRETKEKAEEYNDAKPLHQWMKDIFTIVKSVSIKDPPEKRQKIYDKCITEMKMLIEKFSAYKHLRKIITKIKNGFEFWFTRIKHPEIKPTNNDAERPLREIVIIKHIIGTLRNQKGADILAKIMSLLSTWKLQEKNKYQTLKALI